MRFGRGDLPRQCLRSLAKIGCEQRQERLGDQQRTLLERGRRDHVVHVGPKVDVARHDRDRGVAFARAEPVGGLLLRQQIGPAGDRRPHPIDRLHYDFGCFFVREVSDLRNRIHGERWQPFREKTDFLRRDHAVVGNATYEKQHGAADSTEMRLQSFRLPRFGHGAVRVNGGAKIGGGARRVTLHHLSSDPTRIPRRLDHEAVDLVPD